MFDWIYTADKEPEQSGRYLTVDGYGVFEVSDYWADASVWYNSCREEFEPIAWMKIPGFMCI